MITNENGIYSITNTFTKLTILPVYNVLDSLFNKLIQRLSINSYEFYINENQKGIDINKTIQNNCLIISKNTIDTILKMKSASEIKKNNLIPSNYSLIYDGISLSHHKISNSIKKKLQVLEDEIKFYNNYLNLLKVNNEDYKILDPGNFLTFEKYSKNFKSNLKFNSLKRFYNWQIRTKDMLNSLDNYINKKQQKIRDKKSSYQQEFEKLSNLLQSSINQVKKIEDNINCYKERIESIEFDKKITEKYIWALKNFEKDKISIEKVIKIEENNNNKNYEKLLNKFQNFKNISSELKIIEDICNDFENKLLDDKDFNDLLNETKRKLLNPISKLNLM